MKIKLLNLETCLMTLQKVKQLKWNLKTTWKLIDLNEMLEKEYKKYSEQRKLIIDKYGKKDKDGKFVIKDNLIMYEEDKEEQAIQEMKELLEFETEIPFSPINISDENIQISLEELAPLKQFFTMS